MGCLCLWSSVLCECVRGDVIRCAGVLGMALIEVRIIIVIEFDW